MIVELEAAIRARLVADTTLTGLLSTTSAVYNQFMPPDTAFPYIVFDVEDSVPADAFRVVRETVTVRVHWLCDERPNDNAYSPIVRGRAIEMRILGDWFSQTAGTGPTFGLDRWQPSLGSSGWEATIMRRTRVSTEHTPGVMHWIMTFEVTVNKAGA